MNYPSLPVVPNAFRQVDTHEKAYLLGFLLADGCVREPGERKSFRVVLRILTEDRKVCLMLQEIAGGNVRMIESGYRVEWDVTCKPLGLDLIALGVTPRKSHTVAVNWDRIPECFHGSVLAGLIDGDGHLRFNRKERRAGISLVTASPYLRDQLLERFPFLKVQVCPAGRHRKADLYTLLAESNRVQLRALIERVYDPLPFPILDRKQPVLQQIRDYLAELDAYDTKMAEVPNLKASGLTIQEIADHLGVSRAPVQQRLKAAGVDSRQFVYTDEDRQAMRWMHERGMTVVQIHAAIGKGTKQAVLYQVQRIGCITRTKKVLPRSPYAEEVLKRHQAGEPAYRIAKSLCMSPETIASILRREGVVLQGGSPQKLTEDMVRWADAELVRGRTLRAVAKELGVSETLVRLRRRALLGGDCKSSAPPTAKTSGNQGGSSDGDL